MGVGGILGSFYGKIEDTFFGAMDFLDEKGIPVYNFIDPLEERGIPALPLSIALLIVIGFFAYAFLFANLSQTEVTLDLTSAGGAEKLRGVQLEAVAESGKKIELEGTLFSDGQKIVLPGVGPGQTIVFQAAKEGYFSDDFSLKVTGANDVALLRLEKDIKIIAAKIKLIDPTGDNVASARVVANFSDDTSVICSNLGNGVYSCDSVKEGETVEVLVTSSNYEDLSVRSEFFENSEKQFTMTPKPSAALGQTNLIIRVVDEKTQKPVLGSSIKIYDASDDGLITDITDEDGEFLAKINKGTSIRLSVSAEDFVRFDSLAEGIERTLRSDEELWTVPMRHGGVSVTVRVRDEGDLPQTGIEVLLFDSLGKTIGSKVTGFGGEVVFDDLNAVQTFFVSAFKTGYLPARQEIVPVNSREVDLKLVRSSLSNSARLQVYVLGADGLAANDVSLSFFEVSGEDEIPLGLPVQKSDVSGKFSESFPLGITVLARAVKGNLFGEDSVEIQSSITNELFIELLREANFVDLKLVDSSGVPITAGYLRIESSEGKVLFDEDLEGLSSDDLFFDPLGNDFVKVTFVSPESKTFTSQVFVKDLGEIVVTIGDTLTEGFTPAIEFKGVFDVAGKPVDGISRGQDYYLQFEATFPQGNGKHGVHVRVGDDTVKYADSQDTGITGFSAVALNPFYGRTFSPFPEPGFEGVDFSNEGKAGNYNKWIELYFDEPGTKIIKVRVQAKETGTAPNFDVHFRAWSEFDSTVNRAPQDPVLGTDYFNSQKSGLYADTFTGNVRIFEETSNCREEICASYRFLNKDNSEVKTGDFKPIVNELYALEVTVNPLVDIDATIKATTSKSDPKLFFQGYAIDGATVFPDNNKTDTSIEVSGILSPSGKPVEVLLFFKTVDIETTSIAVQTINGSTVINDNFFFEVFRDKELFVSTTPSQVVFGEDFSFVVQDSEGDFVENALIVLEDSFGEHLETIAGIGITDKGKNGVYKVFNTFDTGILRYTVSAPQFKPYFAELEIVRKNVLQLPDKVQVKIIGGQIEAKQVIELENISGESVDNISFEITRIGKFPAQMNLLADPPSFVAANSSQPLTLTATFGGGEETAHGEAVLEVRGQVSGQFNVSAKTKVVIDFNPTLPEDCLEFSKAGLLVYLESGSSSAGLFDNTYNQTYYNPSLESYDYSGINQNLGLLNPGNLAYDPSRYYNNYDYSYYGLDGSTAALANQYQNPYNRYYGYNDSKQVEFVIRNKCDVPIELTPETISRNSSFDDGISIQVNDVKLSPAGTVQSGKRMDEKLVQVRVTNSVLRNYPSLSSFNFDIFFNSPAVSKSIPLNILIWDPVFGLEVGRNIELWLAQENPTVPARAQSPIFVRNVGQSPIENLSFSQTSGGASRGNVDVRIEPVVPVRFLAVGSALLPPKVVVAEAARTEKTTPIDQKIISVKGNIDGRLRDFGPIYVTTHVSGFECLSVVPNNLEFVSSKTSGTISKKLTIKNSCSEEVRVTQVVPNQFGSNTLSLVTPNLVIAPGSQSEVELILNKNVEWEQQSAVSLDAFLVRSARFTQSNPINVDIKIGEEAVRTDQAIELRQVLVCNTGETKAVAFPKIAATPDCENAYCDAELLAEFLVSKASDKLKEVKREISNYKSDILNTSCQRDTVAAGYCDFAHLNTRTETFTVFFQNDNLTPELLKSVAEHKAPDLGQFQVDYIVGKNVGSAIGQIGNKVLLNGTVSGCGRYKVTIDGAVKVIGQKLDPQLVNILIDFFPDTEQDDEGELTLQCLPRIQNIMNFLPTNKGFENISDTGQTWLGSTQTKESELDNMATEVARELFSSEQRFSKTPVSGNYLELGFGETGEYLVKLEMQKETLSGPRKISALVKETQVMQKANTLGEKSVLIELQEPPAPPTQPVNPPAGELPQPTAPPVQPNQPTQPNTPPAQPTPPVTPPSDPQPIQREPVQPVVSKTQVQREAAKAIAGLKKNAIDGCISENEDFILLKSAVELSGFEIELGACIDQISGKQGVLTVIPGSKNCCVAKVSSPLQESVLPKFIATDIPGIKDTKLFSTEQKELGSEVELAELDERTKKYSEEFLLCTTGDERDFDRAVTKKITLEARSSKNEQRKATDEQVELQVCGIHPNKLIEKTLALKDARKGDKYYATLVWQGEPDRIQLSDIRKLAQAKSYIEGARALGGGNVSGQSEIESQKRTKKLEGLGIYLGACGATSVISSWKFGFGWFTDGVFNCLLPAMYAGADLFETTKAAKDFVIETIKDIPVIGNFADFIGEQAEKVYNILGAEPETVDQTELDSLAVGALTSVPAYTAARIVGGSIQHVNALNNVSVANQISNQLSKEIIDEEFRKIFLTPGPRTLATISPLKRDVLRVAIRDAYNEEIKNALNKFRGRTLNYSDIPQGSSKTILQQAVEEATAEVAKNEKVLDAFSDMKGDLIKATSKNAFEEAEKSLEKNINDISALKDNATSSARTQSILSDTANPKVPDAGDLTTKRNRLVNDFIEDNIDEYKQYLSNTYGDEFLNEKIGTGTRTVQAEFESKWKTAVRSRIRKIEPQLKEVPLPRTGTIVEHTLEFTESDAKKVLKSAVNAADNASTLKPRIEKFVTRKASEKLFAQAGINADNIITSNAGKYRVNYSKFKNLLTSPATLTFWKNMAKGVFTGAVANAAGLWAYKNFMDEHGKIEGAQTNVRAFEDLGIDSDGDGIADSKRRVEKDDMVLLKYKTYEITIDKVDKNGKVPSDGFSINAQAVDPSTLENGAKRIQECDKSFLNTFELQNIYPDPAVFKKENLSTANFTGIINYGEKYGAILRKVDRQPDPELLEVPEALLVTVAVWHTGLGAQTEDWIAGCRQDDLKTRLPEDNFACAAKELQKDLDNNKCKGNVKCALQEYHNAPNKVYSTQVNFDELVKAFEVWDRPEFKLASRITD